MDNDDFWTTVRGKATSRGERSMGSGAIRAALLFGTIAIAVATILPPLLSARSQRDVARALPYDTMSTGSIRANRQDRTYTIRRSITQPMPDAICIIDGSGSKKGAC